MSKLKKAMLIKQEANVSLLKALIILKDNDWSYRKTVGAISTIRLSNLRLRNMLSLQMTIIPSNVRSTNFSEEKSWFASAS